MFLDFRGTVCDNKIHTVLGIHIVTSFLTVTRHVILITCCHYQEWAAMFINNAPASQHLDIDGNRDVVSCCCIFSFLSLLSRMWQIPWLLLFKTTDFMPYYNMYINTFLKWQNTVLYNFFYFSCCLYIWIIVYDTMYHKLIYLTISGYCWQQCWLSLAKYKHKKKLCF